MKNPAFSAIGRIPPRFLADFDSGTTMVRSTGAFLRGIETSSKLPPRDQPGLKIRVGRARRWTRKRCLRIGAGDSAGKRGEG